MTKAVVVSQMAGREVGDVLTGDDADTALQSNPSAVVRVAADAEPNAPKGKSDTTSQAGEAK